MSAQIISIDWLQLYCHSTGITTNTAYEYKLLPYQSKQFRVLYEVYCANEEFATIQAVPVSKIIPPQTVIVKFKNRLLYGADVIQVAQLFLKQSNLELIGLTRLDLALDFNSFRHGFYPTTFIQRFLNSEILKIGQGKYTLIGSQKFGHVYDYLRFGSKTSEVNTYLYNKTKELNQVVDKPYIRKKWLLQNLNLSQDVWRLEVSIKSSGMSIVRLDTGELEKIDFYRLNDSQYISSIFFSYINQYFRFVWDDGQKNKTRMKPVSLFSSYNAEYKPLYLPKSHGAARTDKIFVKKLYLLDSELRNLNGDDLEVISVLKSMYIEKNNLDEYVANNREKWKRFAVKPT